MTFHERVKRQVADVVAVLVHAADAVQSDTAGERLCDNRDQSRLGVSLESCAPKSTNLLLPSRPEHVLKSSSLTANKDRGFAGRRRCLKPPHPRPPRNQIARLIGASAAHGGAAAAAADAAIAALAAFTAAAADVAADIASAALRQ